MIVKWNEDKPHRCPECHAVARWEGRVSKWNATECYRCDTRFARFPRVAGIVSKIIRPYREPAPGAPE